MSGGLFRAPTIHWVYNNRVKLARQKRKAAAVAAMKEASPCADCGGFFPAVAMDWDHVSGDKHLRVSLMCKEDYSMERILAEIAKCELVCSNCHRVRTADRNLLD